MKPLIALIVIAAAVIATAVCELTGRLTDHTVAYAAVVVSSAIAILASYGTYCDWLYRRDRTRR